MDTGTENRPRWQLPLYKLFLIVGAFGICLAAAGQLGLRWRAVGVVAGIVSGVLIAATTKSNLYVILEVGLFAFLGIVVGVGFVPAFEHILANNGSDFFVITPFIANTSAAIATAIGAACGAGVAIWLQRLRRNSQ